MSNELRIQQQEILLENVKTCERTEVSFRFGPFNRRTSHELGEVFQALGVGFFGSYSTTSSKDIPELVYLHVMHKQAEKLSKVLADLGVKSEKGKHKTEEAPQKKEQDQSKPKKNKPKTEKKTGKGRWSNLKDD